MLEDRPRRALSGAARRGSCRSGRWPSSTRSRPPISRTCRCATSGRCGTSWRPSSPGRSRRSSSPPARRSISNASPPARSATRNYREARDRHIAPGPDGGAPVVAGTDLTVHAVLARLEAGAALRISLPNTRTCRRGPSPPPRSTPPPTRRGGGPAAPPDDPPSPGPSRQREGGRRRRRRGGSPLPAGERVQPKRTGASGAPPPGPRARPRSARRRSRA